MHFLDIDYSKQVYLVVLYSSIIEEIENGSTQGQIIRRLKKDGSSLEAAEELYQYISLKKTEVSDLIIKMNENIKNIKTEYELNQSRQLVKNQTSYFEQQMQQEKELKEFGETALHNGLHLLQHLILHFIR